MTPEQKPRFRVYGCVIGGITMHTWHYGTLGEAHRFAEQMARETGRDYEVMEYLGAWRRATPPAEFIPAAMKEPKA